MLILSFHRLGSKQGTLIQTRWPKNCLFIYAQNSVTKTKLTLHPMEYRAQWLYFGLYERLFSWGPAWCVCRYIFCPPKKHTESTKRYPKPNTPSTTLCIYYTHTHRKKKKKTQKQKETSVKPSLLKINPLLFLFFLRFQPLLLSWHPLSLYLHHTCKERGLER